MRRATLNSSQAHVYVMRHIKPGMTGKNDALRNRNTLHTSLYLLNWNYLLELQLEALFKAHTNYYGGSRHVAYTCICGCGPNGKYFQRGFKSRFHFLRSIVLWAIRTATNVRELYTPSCNSSLWACWSAKRTHSTRWRCCRFYMQWLYFW